MMMTLRNVSRFLVCQTKYLEDPALWQSRDIDTSLIFCQRSKIFKSVLKQRNGSLGTNTLLVFKIRPTTMVLTVHKNQSNLRSFLKNRNPGISFRYHQITLDVTMCIFKTSLMIRIPASCASCWLSQSSSHLWTAQKPKYRQQPSLASEK